MLPMWLYVVSSSVVVFECMKECMRLCIARESRRTVTAAERNDVVVNE